MIRVGPRVVFSTDAMLASRSPTVEEPTTGPVACVERPDHSPLRFGRAPARGKVTCGSPATSGSGADSPAEFSYPDSHRDGLAPGGPVLCVPGGHVNLGVLELAIDKDILAYNAAQSAGDKKICDALAKAIDRGLPKAESKIWHAHPVWFLDGNPVAGYSKLKDSVRLLFWSGQSFDEPGLKPEGKFKAAEARFTDADQIPARDLARWIKKAAQIQWDYKNIVKRKGKLERLV